MEKKIKSKIEIELTEKEAGHLRTLLEGGIKISDSISQGEVFENILDHLNSQDQEEVKNPEYDGIREVERQKFKNIVDTVNKRYPQDAPEEWVEKLWELIDVYRDSKDINSELEGIEEVNQYVEQLLDERECRAREETRQEERDMFIVRYATVSFNEVIKTIKTLSIIEFLSIKWGLKGKKKSKLTTK